MKTTKDIRAITVIILVLSLLLHGSLFAQQTYRCNSFSLEVDNQGVIRSFRDRQTSKEFLSVADCGPVIQIVKDGQAARPQKAVFTANFIRFIFADASQAEVEVSNKADYLRFELRKITGSIDAVIWGPIPTVIADTIGNAVGVVRNKEFAIGIKSLNTKTTGGVLANAEGTVYETGTTAIAAPFGSSLQAFSINRSVDRKIKVWDRWADMPVSGIKGGKLEGSAIALFGCRPANVINLIEKIILNEHLPYAKLQGKWIKKGAESGQSYLITSFNENNVGKFLTFAKRTGMAGVYHEDPFDNWGHFVLKGSSFPSGITGFKKCVDSAHAMGLRMGFHTLSNFITTNDAYVTPKPDARLAVAGSSSIAKMIDTADTEITVESAKYFTMRSDLNCVRIGDELVRFMEVSQQEPFVLKGCIRGAFGTIKAAHTAGTKISRLVDHPYKVLFPDWKMQEEIAGNIAAFINQTGADQMDFDGHEGTYANGMGDLSFGTFAEQVFRQVQHPFVFGSSRAGHYFWNFNNYLNWGEPWYGAFRESQSDIRIANQHFYEDNYLPNMLGWFLITETTHPDDIEWMLARAAGYNAGYALVVREEALKNPRMEEIISLINLWTSAQHDHLFTTEQVMWLKNTSNEAQLTKINGKLQLRRFKKFEFEHKRKMLQPGEPTTSNWKFENLNEAQTGQLILLASGNEGKLIAPVIEIDNSYRLEIPVELNAGESLVLGNSDKANVYDKTGKFLKQLTLQRRLPDLSKGAHLLSFDAQMKESQAIVAKITLKLLERTEILKSE